MFGGVTIEARGVFDPLELPFIGWVTDKKIKRLMKNVGRTHVKTIRDRTKSGIDANGKNFIPLAKSTRMASKPRPKRGSRNPLPSTSRGGASPLYQTGNTFLNKISYVDYSTDTGGVTHFFVKDVPLENGSSSAAVAAVHNSGKSFGPMTQANLKGGKYFRIPIRTNKGRKDIGILKKFVRGRRLPKREFMGITKLEMEALNRSILTYLKTNRWSYQR